MTGRHAAPRPRRHIGKTLAVIGLGVAFTAGTSSALAYTVLRETPMVDDSAVHSAGTDAEAQGTRVSYPGEPGRPSNVDVVEPRVTPVTPSTAGLSGLTDPNAEASKGSAPHDTPSPIPTPAPVVQATPAPAATPTPGLIAGDYLTREVAAYWPNSDADNVTIDDQAGISTTLPAHLHEYLTNTTVTGYIVAMLGTLDLNDSVEQFQRDLDTLTEQHPGQCIVWVTTHHMDYGFSGIPLNALLRERTTDGLIVADWATQVANNSSLVTTDGRHVTAYSGPELTRSIVEAARACTTS